MPRPPLDMAPGFVRVDAPYSQPGRFIDGDKVRFVRDLAQKIGGYLKLAPTQFEGVCRALHTWDDFSQNQYIAIGTTCKLLILESDGTITNITPFRIEGELTDPFTTTNGSATVVVSHVEHGLQIDDVVHFEDATAVGGLTIEGDYTVSDVIDADSYEIEAASAATSSDTGGGTVEYGYEIPCGNVDVITGGGYGVGRYGEGTYGTRRTSSNFIQFARVWFLDDYGKNLLALPLGGKLYQWDPQVGGRAAAVANAPINNLGMFITDDRHVIVIGADGDKKRLAWPDQNDITNWTPGIGSTANIRNLNEGSFLVAGTVVANRVNLIWSDTAAYILQYTGSEFVFDSRLAGTNCGLIGPKAFTTVSGVALWMSGQDFHMFAGAVREIPNVEDVRQWIFGQLNEMQNWKAFCRYVQRYNEVWWHIVTEDASEPNLYAAVNIKTWAWVTGTFTFTAATNQESIDHRPIAASADRHVHIMETGVDADGEPMPWFLDYAPADISNGEVSIDLFGFIPNFERQVGEIDLTITTHDYPDEEEPIEVEEAVIAEKQGIVDLHSAGRQVGFRISGDGLGSDFRLGKPRVEIDGGGARR